MFNNGFRGNLGILIHSNKLFINFAISLKRMAHNFKDWQLIAVIYLEYSLYIMIFAADSYLLYGLEIASIL